jgi:hypothetical protein
MVAQRDHRHKGAPPNTPYVLCQMLAIAGNPLRKINDQKYLYQR